MALSLRQFQERRDEAFAKLYEMLEDGLEKADYIAIDEVKQEIAKRYANLAQRGWPGFWHTKPNTCPECGEGLHHICVINGIQHFTCIACDAHISANIYGNAQIYNVKVEA
jgi:hypothetical protein